MNIKNKNISPQIIEQSICKEEAPYQFKLGIQKSNKIQNCQINQEIKAKLSEYNSENIVLKEQNAQPNGNEKNDLIYKFEINDKQKALACFRFFNGHYHRKKQQNEQFLKDESFRIYYNIDESKQVKQQIEFNQNHTNHNNNHKQKHQYNFQNQQINNPFAQNIYSGISPQFDQTIPQNDLSSNHHIKQANSTYPLNKINKYRSIQQQNQYNRRRDEKILYKKKLAEQKQQQKYEILRLKKQLQKEQQQRQDQQITVDKVLTSMHTFCNNQTENIRKELLNRENPISVSEVKHEYEIKRQLDPDNILNNQDPDEIFTCSICCLVVLDPKICIHSNCSKLFCSKCLQDCKDKKCPNCFIENEKNFEGDIPRIVKNQYQKLTFKCPYDDECSFKGTLQQALIHLKNCEMFQVQCRNNCGKWVAQRDLNDHEMYLCEHSEVMCQYCHVVEKPFTDDFHHNCLEKLKKINFKLSNGMK